ncbi:MAG: hypothetical protein FD189_2006 [Elusimicrobia bacterium]|nr:MAG: hypothetical protein FD154_2133 [Elusimicrobiota bacterium]KAF0154246.1 MAG: hypothetical protein FD189_2006 [Elusimicrobiota bacterium]
MPPAGRFPNADIATALFYILTPDGKAMSAVNTEGLLRKAGITYGDIWPLRAKDGYLWFNAGNKFLVKAGAADMAKAQFWEFPKVVRERHILQVRGRSGVERGILRLQGTALRVRSE